MKNSGIASSKQKLDSLFRYIDELRKLNNLELEAQWSLYLCIRVSGLLETAIKSIYINYCNDKAHPNIIKHVGKNFETSRSKNMKPETIINLASSFSDEWRSQLEDFLSDNGRKEAIESIVNIRNVAAHGGTNSVTYSTAKGYYEKVWEVIEFIERQCS